METNLLIKNTLESSLKSFNDSVLFNMNLLMQQWLPQTIQPPQPPPTTIPLLATTKNPMPAPSPSPMKSPRSNPPPPSTEGWQWCPKLFSFFSSNSCFFIVKKGEKVEYEFWFIKHLYYFSSLIKQVFWWSHMCAFMFFNFLHIYRVCFD